MRSRRNSPDVSLCSLSARDERDFSPLPSLLPYSRSFRQGDGNNLIFHSVSYTMCILPCYGISLMVVLSKMINYCIPFKYSISIQLLSEVIIGCAPSKFQIVDIYKIIKDWFRNLKIAFWSYRTSLTYLKYKP